MDHEDAKKIAERFVRGIERSDMSELFADDAFADINVPLWRFQMQGVGDINAWLQGELPNGSGVGPWRADPTASGVVVELEQHYEHDGQPIMSRNIHRLEVRDGSVTEWTMYCTGEWGIELRDRQAKEAPMFRP